MVPQTAVLQDREGRYVYLLGENDVVAQRRIETGARVGNGWAVSEGLEGGEPVVVQGTFVLLAVVTPTAFLPGINGQLYRQFAVTLSSALVISAIVALTLSPALSALMLRTPRQGYRRGPLGWFARALDTVRDGYGRAVGFLVRVPLIPLAALTACFAGAPWLFMALPSTLLPDEDQGALFLDVQLPEAASLERTREVMAGGADIARHRGHRQRHLGRRVQHPAGHAHPERRHGRGRAGSVGGSGGARAPARRHPRRPARGILHRCRRHHRGLRAARHPRGRRGRGTRPAPAGAARATARGDRPGRPGLPRRREPGPGDRRPVDLVQRRRSADPRRGGPHPAETLGVSVADVFSTIGVNFGSRYVNDFTLEGRVFQVNLQAEADARAELDDLLNLHVRSSSGAMVPLRNLASTATILAPYVISRYNLSVAAPVNGQAAAGGSSGAAMAAVERVAAEALPDGYGYEWSGLSFQERQPGGQAPIVFGLALLFAFLFLVA